jgi:hypothetical protein
MFVPLDEAIDVAYLQLNARLFHPAVFDAFEEAIEEALLQLDAVIGVEVSPMLEAMRSSHLCFERARNKSLEIAAGCKPCRPIAADRNGTMTLSQRGERDL